MVFPVVMLDYRESWALKNFFWKCFWTFELWHWRRLLSPLDCKEIKPVNLKGISPNFIGRIDAEAETLIFYPPDVKNWLIRKDPDAGEDWRQEEKGATEDEMTGCHHWHNGHEFEQTMGENGGQRSLVCCSPWGHIVRHDLATEQQQKLNTKKRLPGETVSPC